MFETPPDATDEFKHRVETVHDELSLEFGADNIAVGPGSDGQVIAIVEEGIGDKVMEDGLEIASLISSSTPC